MRALPSFIHAYISVDYDKPDGILFSDLLFSLAYLILYQISSETSFMKQASTIDLSITHAMIEKRKVTSKLTISKRNIGMVYKERRQDSDGDTCMYIKNVYS